MAVVREAHTPRSRFSLEPGPAPAVPGIIAGAGVASRTKRDLQGCWKKSNPMLQTGGWGVGCAQSKRDTGTEASVMAANIPGERDRKLDLESQLPYRFCPQMT